MKLTQLAVDSYKRISVAVIDIDPDAPGVVALMGKNEQGKSSALDAFESLMAGRKARKMKRPVHTGAEKATIVATFREDDGATITVRRIYKVDGSTSIEVRQDGLKVARPDDILRRLYSHVALDPLAFANSDTKLQVQTLLGLIGFDPTALDERRANLYATRTSANQDVTRLKGRLEAFPAAVDVIPERIDVAATAAELDRALEQSHEVEALDRGVEIATDEVTRATSEVARLREALTAAEGNLVNWQATLETRTAEADAASQALPDTAPIRERLQSAEAHNSSIAQQIERAAVATELAAAEARSAELTASITAVDEEKVAGFDAHPMPVPGLTIEDGEVYLDGTPFAETSAGGKLRTSVAIAMALNPDLRAILVRDGSLLDGDNRKIIHDLARDNDYTVLMEIVDETAETGVIFEDGRIREVRA